MCKNDHAKSLSLFAWSFLLELEIILDYTYATCVYIKGQM